ncbi:MAG: hypothetical protein JWO87_3620, partial [Phycisphaerales bacterium]|nr:hypothetical protein [Phycisphaerales bacterium]
MTHCRARTGWCLEDVPEQKETQLLSIVATTLMISSVATIAALAFAIALLAWGIRGRRVDDHPICAHCGFDLVGTPASSYVCSECGSDLRDSWAVRTG